MKNDNAVMLPQDTKQLGINILCPVTNVFLKSSILIDLFKLVVLLTENFKCDRICRDLKYSRISAMNHFLGWESFFYNYCLLYLF